MVHDFWYTVLSTLHHHTRTKHTAEVGTLDGVHRTSGIDGTYTVLLPIIWVRYSLTIFISRNHIITIIFKYSTIIIGKQCQEIVSIHHRRLGLVTIALGITCSFLILTILDTNISQLIVSSLTGVKSAILFDGYFTVVRYGIIVSAIVGDIQTTITIDKGQVTVTIKASGMTRTDGNQVAVINIMDRCRGIAKNSRGIGIDLGRTRRRVTSGKHGIVDDNTFRVQTFPSCLVIRLVQ